MGNRVCHVSFSNILTDERIQRDVRALRQAGYDVGEIGFGAGLTLRPMTPAHKIRLAAGMIPANLLPAQWSNRIYWRDENAQALYHGLIRQRPGIIHAHDWDTLPAAARAARKLRARLIYDSHEAAAVQRSHRLLWRLTFPAHIRALEAANIPQADRVITVSDGIAAYLRSAYKLRRTPDVIRSIPEYEAHAFRPTDPDNILVHYHGIFTQGRGLENLVLSVRHWPPAFRLRLTGWGQPERFAGQLKALAKSHGVTHRIDFAARIPYDQLLAHAAGADIGICFWAGETAQQRFVLPNKFFEYTTAGLMLCVGPGEEMHALIARHEHGLALPDNAPETLAMALQNLTPARIDACKAQALAAAKILNWQHEREKLLNLYAQFE